MNQHDWREKIGGLRFDGSVSKKMNVHLEIEDFAGGYVPTNLEI